MKLALVGKAGAGKTTIFNAMTGSNAAVGAGSVPSDRTAVLKVPDDRLGWLADEVYQPKKITPTTIDVADLGGLGSAEGGPRASEVLAAARDADALILVVRAFTEPTYPYPRPDSNPHRDLSDLIGDLVFADLAVATKRVERLQKDVLRPMPERDKLIKELAYLEKVVVALEAGEKVRSVEGTDEERKLTRGYGFLSEKPWVLLVNRGEEVAGPFDLEAEVDARAEIAGRLELELGELDEEERAVFMEEMGVDRLHTGDVIAACYRGLDVVTYFTCGPTEVRSWTLPRGGSAVDAAANVHSDLARGFIRAEVMTYEDLREHGSEKDVKAAGKFRLEGKTYIVAEGDVLLIRFSV